MRLLCRGGRLCPPVGSSCSTEIFGKFRCSRAFDCRGRCRSQPFATKERYGCGSAACRYTSAHWAAADWSQIPIKTEAVFLVGSRESEGKSKFPPNREFSSRFGKEEMSTEDKRRRLRRLVPPWSFLTRQRFLLEKQKKMLCRTCKFAAVHRPLCSFPETPEASPMRGSCQPTG